MTKLTENNEVRDFLEELTLSLGKAAEAVRSDPELHPCAYDQIVSLARDASTGVAMILDERQQRP